MNERSAEVQDGRFSFELLTDVTSLLMRHEFLLPVDHEARLMAYDSTIRALASLIAAFEGQAVLGVYGRHALIDAEALMGGADRYQELRILLERMYLDG